MTNRTALLVLVSVTTLPVAGCCCLQPWGNAASWSFATKRPNESDLIGTYRVQPFLSGDLRSAAWPSGRLILAPDNRATFTACPSVDWYDGWNGGTSTLLDATGTWSVIATPNGYFEVEFLLNSGEYAGRKINLTVWHNSPKHKLWVQQGDPDQGDGIRFDPVEIKPEPKSESTPAAR